MPETKFGKCPWCERHNVVLYFALGQHDGELWCDWICGKCMDTARNLKRDEQTDDCRTGD